MGISDKLFDDLTSHLLDLLRYSEGVREGVTSMLYDLQTDLSNKTLNSGVAASASKVRTITRQEKLIEEARKTIDRSLSGVNKYTDAELFDLADAEVRFAKKMLEKRTGVEFTQTKFSRASLKQLSSNAMIQGAPVKDWWSKQSTDLQQRFAQQVRMGVLAGEDTPTIVQRVRGTATGKNRIIHTPDGKRRIIKEFEGGVTATTTREATTLVRTSVQTVSNNVLSEVYEKNKDLLRGVQAQVTLDNRTSEICMSRSGGAWDFNGKPLPESKVQIPFPGPPPWHHNCRTVLIPIFKASDKLKLKKIPEGKQASMDGQVAGDMSYEDWLKTKPESFQQEVLGPGKFDLWKSGKLKLSDLTDQTGRPLTLKELHEKANRLTEAPKPSTHTKIDASISGGNSSRKVPEYIQKNRTSEQMLKTDAETLLPADVVRPEEQVKRVSAAAKAVAANSQVFVRVPSKVLTKVFEEGRFKNQFETGSSKGLYDPTERLTVEENVLGVSKETPPEKRPIYGYLYDAGSEGLAKSTEQYGDVVVRFKDDVRSRTTFTGIDSLDRQVTVTAKPLNSDDIDFRVGFQEGPMRKVIAKPVPDDFKPSTAEVDYYYYEAQIHNGVTTDDIEHVVFTKAPTKKILSILEGKKIPYTVKASK